MADLVNDSNLEAVSGGASSKPSTYTVKAGDTLSGIAQKYGTTWRALFALNEQNIVSTAQRHGVQEARYDDYANHIYAGQVLRLR